MNDSGHDLKENDNRYFGGHMKKGLVKDFELKFKMKELKFMLFICTRFYHFFTYFFLPVQL